MRILFVTNLRYPPQGLGGARLSTHQLAEGLRARGHDVAALSQVHNKGWLWVGNRVRARFGHRQFPADNVLGYAVYRGWRPLEGIEEVVWDFRPDIAVACTSSTLAIATRLISLCIPTIAYFHTLEFDKFGKCPEDISRLDAFSVSQYVADRILDVLGVESTVVPSVIPPERYQTERSPERILHVNPEESKGIRITLELARRRSDLEFDIVRCWPLTDATKRVRDEIGEMPNVRWHEPVTDMRRFYRQCRVLLVPSLWEEAAGRVVQEAQLSGIPVLASNRGGLPETVGPGGFVLDPEAPIENWLDALDVLSTETPDYDRLSHAARFHARRDEVDPDRIVRLVEDLLSAHIRACA